jgi:hypothetical protein
MDNIEPDNEHELIEIAKRQIIEHFMSDRPRFIFRSSQGIQVEMFFDEIFFDEKERKKVCSRWEWLPMPMSYVGSLLPTESEDERLWHEVETWRNEIVSEWSQRTKQKVVLNDDGDTLTYIDGATIATKRAGQST